ncbi:ATP-binding protein [Flavitalea sp.]|nr:tetratricopeptide repeat-containing sensor histidine kinase [Flavitalea sp.]
MKFILFIFSFSLLQTGLFAQTKGQSRIDSLLMDLNTLKDDSGKVRTLGRLAQAYLYVNQKKGIEYSEKALVIAEKMNWKKGIANLENDLGLIIGDTGNNIQSRVHFEKSYVLNKELNSSFNMINNLNNIGRSYQRESNFSLALDYFFKALAIAQEIKSNEQIALVGTNLTASFAAQKNYIKSLEYARMTLKYAELSNTPDNIGKALMQIGIIQIEIKDTVEARRYMARALKVYEEMENPSGVAQVLGNLGPLEYPNYKKAIETMLKAQKIMDEIGATSYMSIGNLGNLGTTYYDLAMHSASAQKKELIDNAEFYLKRGVQLCKETGNTEYLAVISNNLADLEEARGNYKAALGHYKTYYSINDSLFSQDKKNELAGIEGKHNIALKDKEIAISKLELASQHRTQLGLIVGLALLGIIGGLLFWQSRMRKKSNTTLMVLNNQLDEANKVKVKFFGILSHDLRSPIASLINFLHLLKNEPELLAADEKAAYQQQISKSTEELLQTMETMLLWSKEQMENFKPDIKMVQVSELFDYLQKFFPQTSQLNIRFDNPEALMVSGDENYLKVIMQNLTSNAIKALKNTPGGVIEWKARKENAQTILSITDNGPGINEEQVKSLYYEGSGFNAKTGFGFHLIRDLAKAIQYQISIESKPGTSTTFVLSYS